MSSKPEIKTKKFTFSTEEHERLQNIEIGIVNAGATLDGLNVYKNMILGSVYKRLGIEGDAPKGFSKNIRYNLRTNQIEYSEVPNNTQNPDMNISLNPKEKIIVEKK